MGQTYNPIAEHSSVDIQAVMKHIFAEIHDKRQDAFSVYSTTTSLPEYLSMVSTTFSEAAVDVAALSIRNMISDAQNFHDPEYTVFRDSNGEMVVGYKVMDAMSTTLNYGTSNLCW
jgi:hypothetical protein